MLVRALFLMDTILILIQLNDGYVRTYADQHYGRIRGKNPVTGVDPAIIFLIVFGCLVGGFFIICIFGTLILGVFDNGIRCTRRSFRNREFNNLSPL
ncbi:unnamed protein product [Rotaria magnacalcarata]|uniref:Uncharacterized protein n=2 Tax=Rotaria magnacalcarata TaxID=392030 RepID=A0A815SXK0_9BILA|nr:unnamed protein product [Rotaria magnacalcarata]CAF1494592.1 unnamed protein product [Rotaria magnacalcarata]CAF4003462.1 unnamed protein product [Rotaria magnacalcarata]CAF4035918.1 unnamed protein product [Rotaria magnacalcarata]CAF4067436.1 unnamed protein product [Rotaria magnacalcarata]